MFVNNESNNVKQTDLVGTKYESDILKPNILKTNGKFSIFNENIELESLKKNIKKDSESEPATKSTVFKRNSQVNFSQSVEVPGESEKKLLETPSKKSVRLSVRPLTPKKKSVFNFNQNIEVPGESQRRSLSEVPAKKSLRLSVRPSAPKNEKLKKKENDESESPYSPNKKTFVRNQTEVLALKEKSIHKNNSSKKLEGLDPNIQVRGNSMPVKTDKTAIASINQTHKNKLNNSKTHSKKQSEIKHYTKSIRESILKKLPEGMMPQQDQVMNPPKALRFERQRNSTQN